MNGLGRFFSKLRELHGLWLRLFLAALAVLVGLNLFIRPHEPHVHAEVLPGFWAIFGFVVAVVLAFVTKAVLAHILDVSEDFYDD
ncbi:hypothetical protein dsx2_2234 [Desulfovibrio sp. X2]|uniref:hypothetical protein n=1 Tax=Desulfovibrio sp. X2 TaxID=941449 RepID=UPI000358C65B|nr:hypothetical protein [Desulfovibrio sp. X2]EPR43617.1 hypothetical protein dsx2_2234 [Desulfovibrio sp. X2]